MMLGAGTLCLGKYTLKPRSCLSLHAQGSDQLLTLADKLHFHALVAPLSTETPGCLHALHHCSGCTADWDASQEASHRGPGGAASSCS